MEQHWSENEISLLSQVLPHVAEQFRPALSNLYLTLQHLIPAQMREDSPETDRFAAMACQSYYRMLRTVNNLSSAPQLLSDAPFLLENVNLSQWIETIYQQALPMAQEAGLTLTYQTELPNHSIAVHPEQLERLIWNLLSNAFKFTPPGGKISLTLKKAGGQILFTVRDSGCGISEDAMPTVFDRWLHTDLAAPLPHGFGLGLPLCRNIAQRHGGRLVLQSQEGEGTTVTVALPDKKTSGGQIRDASFDYAGGFQRVMLELSDSLSYRAYLQRNLDE